jgi:hypothetical protein
MKNGQELVNNDKFFDLKINTNLIGQNVRRKNSLFQQKFSNLPLKK